MPNRTQTRVSSMVSEYAAGMLDLQQLLRARSASAGRFDASGQRLYFVSDLSGVPQVWATGGRSWPELVVAPPDRAQVIHPGPRPGQLIVGADMGGNEHTQLLRSGPTPQTWQSLTDDPARIHSFGGWSKDGSQISFSANTRTDRWFDVYVRDLATNTTRRVLEHDSTNRAGQFSPDGRWLVVTRAFSNQHQELWLVDLRGQDAPRLITDPDQEARYQRAQWTPDGSALLCRTDVGREFSTPARLDVTSGQLTPLFESDVDIDETALDPTGRRLAYVRNSEGRAEIIVRDLDSGQETKVQGLPAGSVYSYWRAALAWDL